MKLAAAAALASAGCASLFGLDDTTFTPQDGPGDAPSVCDGLPPACVASTGRTVCGQLLGTGALAGPLRVAAPTGGACAGSVEGPCGLTVSGQALAALFAGDPSGRIAATVDDCGRFAVPDLDAAVADIAVVVDPVAPGPTATVRALIGRPPGPGVDEGVDVPVVTQDTRAAWATQLAVADTDLTAGYLVRYLTGTPPKPEEVRVDGAAPQPLPTTPWAAYFTSDLGVLDPARTATSESGTALVVPPNTTFELGGFRTGKTCSQGALQRPANTFVFLVIPNC